MVAEWNTFSRNLKNEYSNAIQRNSVSIVKYSEYPAQYTVFDVIDIYIFHTLQKRNRI